MPKGKSRPDTQTPITAEIAFGRVLRERPLAKGFTQADLEAVSSIARSYISQLESARRQACLRTIIQLAFSLDITPAQLLDEVVSRIDTDSLDALRNA